MKAKQIFEFQRTGDPKKSLNLGLHNQILNDLEAANLNKEDFELDSNLIKPKNNLYGSNKDSLYHIQLKYLNTNEREFLENICPNNNINNKKSLKELINNVIDNGSDIDLIKQLINIYATKDNKSKAIIYLAQITRSKEDEESDEENNIYVFIGYMEKKPVMINDKQYFEEQLQAENMVKIDKYNVGDLMQIEMMKIRARLQYGGVHGAGVFMVHLPKYIMDEDHYNKIPEEHRYLIEKYKKKI